MLGASVFLLGCVAAFLLSSRHWPLVNDPALMHYTVLLMQRGLAPYRQIYEINLPGAYAPEWLSMTAARWLHVSQAAMWRVFDALALALAAAAMWKVCRPHGWFAAIFAGCLFALLHGRDGVGHAGQRDLWMAVLLLWSIAFLFDALRQIRAGEVALWHVCAFGLLVGAATMLKPFAVLYLCCVLPLVIAQKGARNRSHLAGVVLGGCVMPVLGAGAFLWYWGAWAAMERVLSVDLPYYVSLGHASFAHLLNASTVWSLRKLGSLAMIAVVLTAYESKRACRSYLNVLEAGVAQQEATRADTERLILLASILLGFVCYLLQGKAYPYQRYPYEAFLLLVIAIELVRATRAQGRLTRLVGAAGLSFGVLLCAPTYLRAALKAPWPTDVTAAIERAIIEQAGTAGLASLEGKVQCIDAVTGCTDALLHLGLRQGTGQMYDELLFPETPAKWGALYDPPKPGDALPQAVRMAQDRTENDLIAAPPQVVVISWWLFPEGPGAYQKLKLWPWFEAYLKENYVLASEQVFNRAENGPMGFRVYARRAVAK